MILNSNKINVILISLLLLFLLYIVIIFIFAIIIEKIYFVKRINERKYIKEKDYKYYNNLQKEQYSFLSNKIKINGDIYYYNNKQNKKIIIFSNGFNTTINNYINYIAYFASLGYIVYTYDYAGVGQSEGKKFKGMNQSIIDLNNCIQKVKEDNPNIEIILVGHSMGTYATCNAINFHNINKIIAIAPFNSVSDVVCDTLYTKIGKRIFLFPIIYKLLLFLKFKSYSLYKSFNSLKSSNTKALIIQGEDDNVVDKGLFIQNMITNTNLNINYLLIENKQHDPLLSTDAINYKLYLKHNLSDLTLKYNKKIPDYEIQLLNKNINYELKYKLDDKVLNIIEQHLRGV